MSQAKRSVYIQTASESVSPGHGMDSRKTPTYVRLNSLVGPGEVVPAGQGVRVVRAQDPFHVGEGALKQRDRLRRPPRVPVGASEVVAAGQGARVLRAQDPFHVGE